MWVGEPSSCRRKCTAKFGYTFKNTDMYTTLGAENPKLETARALEMPGVIICFAKFHSSLRTHVKRCCRRSRN